jgi:hypothetical protein
MTCECSATSERYQRRVTSLLKQSFLTKPWRFSVQEYTRLNLTKETDRLVALSGLATAYKNTLDDTYIYGLWESELKTELLWRSLQPGKRLDIAPTWSWASTTAQIDFPLPHLKSWALDRDPIYMPGGWEILSPVTPPEPTSAHDRRKINSEILMSGRLLEISSIEVNEQPLRPYSDAIPGTSPSADCIAFASGKRIWKTRVFKTAWDIDDDELGNTSRDHRRHTLFIVTERSKEPAGLLLERVPCPSNAAPGMQNDNDLRGIPCFRRVGIALRSSTGIEVDNQWSGPEDGGWVRKLLGSRRRGKLIIGPETKDFWSKWKNHSTRQQFSIV